MIPLDKLRAVTHLVTHANCPDGIASALIIKDALPDVRVSFVHYGTEEHKNLPAEPGMLFCDFSPWLPKIEGAKSLTHGLDIGEERQSLIAQWREASVIVLDHHSRDVVEPYGELGVFGENAKLESGAMLAYEQVWKPLWLAAHGPAGEGVFSNIDRVREFARLAAVRDTWATTDPDWQRALEQAEELRFWGFESFGPVISFGGFLGPEYGEPPGGGKIGGQLLQNKLAAARKSIDEAFRFTSARGARVLMFQGVSTTSDAAELLEKQHETRGPKGELWLVDRPPMPDIVVGFHYRVDGGKLQLQFSTRSHTGFDCQAFARAHGGNGHKAAAGFTVEAGKDVVLGNPYQTFEVLLNEWESRR